MYLKKLWEIGSRWWRSRTWSPPSPTNTSTCGTVLTEHLLNAGRRPQTSKKARNSSCTWVAQKKKKREREKKSRCNLHPWEGAVKEERFPHTGKSPHWGDQLGQRGSFRALEKNAAIGLQRAKWRETCTEGQCRPALPGLRHSSAGAGEAGCRGSGFGGQIWRGLGLAAWRQPEGARVW